VEEVTRGWRKLGICNEELDNFYSFPNIIMGYQVKENGVRGICTTHTRYERIIHNIIRKPEEQMPFGDLKFDGWVILNGS
jgi:hypothetical protein